MGQSLQCKICNVIIKAVGGSTSGMHTHLQTKHKISVRKRPASDEATASTSVSACSSSSSSSSKVNKYVTVDKYVNDADESSVGAILARMTSCDGLPFSVFTTSDDLRKALGALGFANLPRSSNTIKKKLVMDHSNRVQQTVVYELALRKKRGERFSLTFDEWTIMTRSKQSFSI
jgi:hypothetical protein